MDIWKAIETLDSVIPPPSSAMVDVGHAAIAEAWREIRETLTRTCESCVRYRATYEKG